MRGIPSRCLPDLRSQLITTLDLATNSRHFNRTLCRAITSGLWHEPFVAGRLVASCSAHDLPLADRVFGTISRPTAFAYNVMMRAHSSGPNPGQSLHLFRDMLRADLYPDRFAFPFLLRASARAHPSSASAATVHALVVRHGLERDPHVATSLFHAYASGGLMKSAIMVFDEMPVRTVVTWNAIISRCSKSTFQQEGLSFFSEMLLTEDVHANADTLVAALSCCAGVGSLAHGKSLHALALRLHASHLRKVGTSLAHMYAKCGGLEYCRMVFERMRDRDASTWTAMIGGLAMHGRGEEAAALFCRMIDNGLRPDSLTFTSVLHACSHCGLVDVGIGIFNDMKDKYEAELRIEHYGAMVDLFARAGRVDEAERLIESMPFEPNSVLWGSLLHACANNGDVALKERLESRFVEQGFGENEGGFIVGVSNVYARDGRWHEVGRVREKMVENEVRKHKGFSGVEVNGRVYKFLVRDTRQLSHYGSFQHGMRDHKQKQEKKICCDRT